MKTPTTTNRSVILPLARRLGKSPGISGVSARLSPFSHLNQLHRQGDGLSILLLSRGGLRQTVKECVGFLPPWSRPETREHLDSMTGALWCPILLLVPEPHPLYKGRGPGPGRGASLLPSEFSPSVTSASHPQGPGSHTRPSVYRASSV